MRILIISGAFPPMASGEAANTFHLCRHLAERGFDVQILTTRQADMARVDWASLHAEMTGWSWTELPRFARFLARSRPDAILMMHLGGIYNYHPMMTFAPTVSKRVLPDVPFVTRFENPLSEARPDRLSPAGRVLHRLMRVYAGRDGADYDSGTLGRDSDRVIVLCSYHHEILRQRYGDIDGKIALIPPPSNVPVIPDPDGALRQRGRDRIGASDGDLVIGYMGYIYPNKGVDTLLRAFARLRARDRNVRLLVLGGRIGISGMDDSCFDKMVALAEELSIADRVTWTGAFSSVDESVAANLHAVDAFALPFDNGIHLNNSSFASLATYGKPVVTTRRDHIDAAFVDGRNVLLTPPQDPDATAAALERLIDEPGLAATLHAGVRALADEQFSWDSALERTLATLGIVGGSAGTRRKDVSL